MNFGIDKGISAIDSAAVREAAGQIFANAAARDVQNETFTLDYSKFNRPAQGADLYAQKLTIGEVQQISVRNAGLDLNFQQNQAIAASVNALNKAAAYSSYGVPHQMDGKVNVPSEAKHQDLNAREVFALPASSVASETQNLTGEKKGSNPFKFVSLANDTEQEEAV